MSEIIVSKEKSTFLNFIGNPRINTYMYYVREYYEKNDRYEEWVGVSDIADYCSSRRKEDLNRPFGDPPRRFELFRKDKCSCYWEERMVGNNKFVKFRIPDEEDIMISKDHGFDKDTIDHKLQECAYKCEITGLPACDGKLAADHWYPKEKGGSSEKENCVILNKILNEKKNNHLPEVWFCKHLLTNFLNISKRLGNLDSVKDKLIKFIQDF